MADLIRTDIFVKGKLHGSRRWPAVPRVGELMSVDNVVYDEDDSHAAWCLIESVRWVDHRGELSHVEIDVSVVKD